MPKTTFKIAVGGIRSRNPTLIELAILMKGLSSSRKHLSNIVTVIMKIIKDEII